MVYEQRISGMKEPQTTYTVEFRIQQQDTGEWEIQWSTEDSLIWKDSGIRHVDKTKVEAALADYARMVQHSIKRELEQLRASWKARKE